ncbi:uncharacterized protein [Littorina saxatilis]|uniref:uncharacterized protein n=1 Tax=Littorina saxatilis TaxID=31220 RepID=UPI0038B5898A
MTTLTSVCCTVVLVVCVLSRAALALNERETRCVVDCSIFGESRFCACADVIRPASVDSLEKRSGVRVPFRFGKRGSVAKRQQRQPFRYGKRSFAGSADLSDYNSRLPSAYDFLEEDM